uniref:carboxypeptidase-like regulatory domain-containing protein n=1 Tax=Pseudomonadota TaxID=1224 RepID=UPI0015E821BF|nr:carboxypeptidase-like regulatory domain-containing protein [Polaromonas sp. E5S]
MCFAIPAIGKANQSAASAESTNDRSVTQTVTAAAPKGRDLNVLILRLQLDDSTLSDGFIAYQDGPQILLPLSELSRLLTLAITVKPESGSASGFLLSQERTFELNIAHSLVSLSGQASNFEKSEVRVIGDDIYVSNTLLSRWFPIDFVLDMSASQLTVKPREKLPLQEKLERLRLAARLGDASAERLADPGYPHVLVPYKMISRPFIDQTFGSNLRAVPGAHSINSAYTAYLTADFLGLEGAAFVSHSNTQTAPEWRITLGRNDPDAGLLGPLKARSFSLGNIAVPSVANIMAGSSTGIGISASNRALDQATSFDRQRLRGDLPPGWDVTLYYNDALLRFQGSRADGLYSFDDLPLSFGRNEFQLVFNGPLGQMRTERKSFLLDQSIVKPGEFLYSLTQHQSDNGAQRSVAQFDFGLTKALIGSAGFIRTPRPNLGQTNLAGQTSNTERSYSQLGLRNYSEIGIVSSQFSFAQDGGMLAELGLKTRLGNYAVDLLHTQLQGGFESEIFSATDDPVKQQNELRVVGTLALDGLPRLPIAINALRVLQKSGATRDSVSSRVSVLLAGNSITNGLNWQRAGATTSTFGNLQLSRRVAEMGLSSQLAYSLKPNASFDSLALSADKNLNGGYRINAGFIRGFSGGETLLSSGVSKDFGSFALALSASYSSRQTVALGIQIFVALGREPRTGKWFAKPLPMANMGAVSVRAFVDNNQNGIRDANEELVPNAGFIINNGGRHPNRSALDGTAFIGQLTPGSYADISLDPSTLEDPLWQPLSSGVRVLPRPGLVQMLEFPVISSSEIDGTVFLLGKDGQRGIGDALVELVNPQGVVISRTTSSFDGFYLITKVMPGSYTLRISPAQVNKLKLIASQERPIKVKPEGDFISGQDLQLKLSQP